MQLSYLLMEKLEASLEIINQTQPVTNQTSYPSLLHPPELDPGLMSVYRDVTIPVNTVIIISSLIALLGLCRDAAQLLLPWMLSFSVGIISEATVFCYLISEGKVWTVFRKGRDSCRYVLKRAPSFCEHSIWYLGCENWENNYSALQFSMHIVPKVCI